MSTNSLIPSLIFMTLFAGLGFALVQFLASLRRRSNRVAASDALLGDNTSSRQAVPDGALPELLSGVGIAVIAMALLGFGYMSSGRSNASVAAIDSGTSGTPASPSQQMTNPTLPRTSPAENPGVPTTSTSGSGR